MKQSPEDKEVSRYFIDTPSWIACNHLIRFGTEAFGEPSRGCFFHRVLIGLPLIDLLPGYVDGILDTLYSTKLYSLIAEVFREKLPTDQCH